MESLVGMKNLVFCSDYNALTLFRILQKEVFRMQGAWQSVKQVILYGSWSNFPYYKPPTPIERAHPICLAETHRAALWI